MNPVPPKRLAGCGSCAKLRTLLPFPLAQRLDNLEQARLRKKQAKRLVKVRGQVSP